MIKIPNSKKQFLQTNLSDLLGNIWYTKNMNFDEQGYAKLSSRSATIASIEDYSNFGYPLSIGRYDLLGNAYITTANATDNVFDITLTNGGLGVNGNGTIGGNRPLGSNNNRGAWWQNAWHVTTNTGLNYYIPTTWTAKLTSVFTTGFPHPLEVFKSQVTLCVGDANIVHQYSTNYDATNPAGGTYSNLTIPTDYTIVGLAYSNRNMGIATQTTATLQGQNQEAQFYVWDGAGVTATGYPVGSDAIMAIKAYKSSWVLLTRNGRLLYFNGGGFDTLATLPYFFKKYTIAFNSMQGDIMTVSGDLIYINSPADIDYYGLKQEKFLQNFNGGILCYDPKVGLYHRYSPSISKLYEVDVSSVDIASDILTYSGTLPATGNPILYTFNQNSPIGGLTVGAVYYIIKHTSTTFSLATTSTNAINGVKINLTSNNTGTFLGLSLTDYGASQGVYGLAITTMGTQDFNYNHLMFGGYVYNTSLSPRQTLFLTVPQFSNRGYFVTSKIESAGIEDIAQKIYIKYKPLKAQDSIIVKYKDKDVIGIPVTTPQRGLTCTWTSSTVLTTTADISEVYTYLQTAGNECECEIVSGTGAGQMPQITSISLNAGTYTVTLAEAVEGVANGNLCNVIIDNWKLVKTITSADTENWAQASVMKSSKWHKYKIEFRGLDTTLEELLIDNKVQIPIT